VRQREEQHHRSEHQHAHELHQRPHLTREHAHRERRREHLRHRVHGETGEHAVLVVAQPERTDQERQPHDHRHAEDRREGDGRGHVFTFGADHRGDGGDGGVPADGVPARDEHRQPMREPHRAADPVRERETKRDERDDAHRERRARLQQQRKVHRRAKQQDGDLEDLLGGERDTGSMLGGADQAERRSMPSRMATTSASITARPKSFSSSIAMPKETSTTVTARARPGTSRGRGAARGVVMA
jgi:hypothetical protein